MTLHGEWFSRPGEHNDVAVSTRVRLARNLQGLPFPPVLGKEEEEELQREVVRAFGPLGDRFTVVYLDRLPPIERRMLLERNIISQDFSVSPNKLVVLSPDERLSAMVNEEDHLRLACIESGLCLERTFASVDELDGELEKSLHFAASMEWGYLNTSLSNAGTGLRASVMLHLPALVMDGNIGWALKRAGQMGLQIKGYWGEGDNSLGDMYQISNPLSVGSGEKDILATVQKAAVDLMEYERKARDEMIAARRMELEDRVHRALGILKHCRIVASKEAIDLLGSVRLGLSLGVLPSPSVEVVTALMILSQKAHIQKLLDSSDDEADNKLVDYTRAKLIRRVLEGRALEDADV
jgi:protein arginine kinase